jgi:hypothetical protein
VLSTLIQRCISCTGMDDDASDYRRFPALRDASMACPRTFHLLHSRSGTRGVGLSAVRSSALPSHSLRQSIVVSGCCCVNGNDIEFWRRLAGTCYTWPQAAHAIRIVLHTMRTGPADRETAGRRGHPRRIGFPTRSFAGNGLLMRTLMTGCASGLVPEEKGLDV